MNRRTAIRQAVIITAGASLLPSCIGGSSDKSAITLKNISLSGSQEKMLAELTETIIPKTSNFVGAKDLKAHEFVLTMVDDCSAPEDQKVFSQGMKEFDNACEKKLNKSFASCSPQQRQEWLTQVETKDNISDTALKFYETTKRYTVQSFVSSKEYMTQIRDYKMVPGFNYKGCVAI